LKDIFNPLSFKTLAKFENPLYKGVIVLSPYSKKDMYIAQHIGIRRTKEININSGRDMNRPFHKKIKITDIITKEK
jgi:hypothetical protein